MAILNIGSMNIDNVYSVPRFICGGETLLSSKLTKSLGGKGFNQSLAAARSGAEVYHACYLGRGGDIMKKYMDENGINTSLLEPCELEQGHTIIQLTPEGQNSIIVFGSSNRAVTKEYIDSVLEKFGPDDYLLLQNEVSELSYTIEAAAAKGIKIVLNASPINDDLFKADFSKVDWLIINELECSAIAEVEDTMKAYSVLKERFPNIGILLTLGADGSCCYKNGTETRQEAYPTTAIDTTGAGDTFLGYFIGCLTNGFSETDALRFASMAASIAVSRPGAGESIPTMKEVKEGINTFYTLKTH